MSMPSPEDGVDEHEGVGAGVERGARRSRPESGVLGLSLIHSGSPATFAARTISAVAERRVREDRRDDSRGSDNSR